MASGIARLCYCRVSRFKRDRTTGLSSRTAREVTILVTSALAGVTLPQTPYLRNYEVVRGCWRPRRDRCGCCQDLTLVASVARRRELQCRCRCRTSDAHLVRPSGRGPLCYGDQMNSRQSEASRSPVCRHHFRQFKSTLLFTQEPANVVRLESIVHPSNRLPSKRSGPGQASNHRGQR